jgi:polar amino acid transport system permease protein
MDDSEESFRTVPVRKPWLWVIAAAFVVLAALFVYSVLTNPNLDWSAVTKYQFASAILDGLRITVVLTVLGAILGLALGILVGLMRLSSSRVLQVGSWFYVWLLRGTPLLVQILLWGNLALLFRHIGPFNTNDLITPFVASVLALGLNEAAYTAEVIRGGVLAVDKGQMEAALTLGMRRVLALRRIVLPQALRVVVPPLGNRLVILLKSTSLVSVIAGGDLLTAAENVASSNLRTIELMLVACFWYLVLTSIANVGQHFIERRLARSQAGVHDVR